MSTPFSSLRRPEFLVLLLFEDFLTERRDDLLLMPLDLSSTTCPSPCVERVERVIIPENGGGTAFRLLIVGMSRLSM